MSLYLIFSLLLLLPLLTTHSLSSPLNCTDPTRVCTSFLAFHQPPSPLPLPLLLSLFDVHPSDISSDPTSSPNFVFLRKNCSCLHRSYFTNTTFTVPTSYNSSSSLFPIVDRSYGGLSSFPNVTRRKKAARPGAVVGLRLYCGCSSGLWNYLMSYVMEEGDTVEGLSSRFGVSMDSIETVNGMDGPEKVVVGRVYYIPLNSVPGQPYVETQISPAPAPAPVSVTYTDSEVPNHHSRKFPFVWVVGSMGVAILLIGVTFLSCVSCKALNCLSHAPKNQSKNPDQPISHKFHILKSSSFCYTSGRFFCCTSGNSKPSPVVSRNHHIDIPKAVVGDAFDMEKPIVFTYVEILSSTDYFSDSNLLGDGTYGSVYYGVLRDQEVAIKRMTATKTKECIAEMKVLCKVHHASLVELIGYAASDDELFLVYEYAQKGSLKSHLHDPQNKEMGFISQLMVANGVNTLQKKPLQTKDCAISGHTSLSWISRVQIAIDAAKGLEYIHEHTKDHYVHRDIKTSNILLDTTFRAKISDFGLAKLVVKTVDGEASATKVVGTFGYLAPEYLRDGLATTKSDVYAFGVVLFELISGKEAITRTEGMVFTNSERRSLASIMLGVLKNSANSMSMASLKEHVDSSLMDLYPHDCVYKMAMLAKQCVDEDPILRPDMKQVVISLSHILLSSIEWESALAGNSQVFSGLVQGR